MNKPKSLLPTDKWRPALTTLCATLAVAGFLTVQAGAQTDPVVAKVNGTEIKESDLKAAEDDIGAQLPPMAPEAKKEYLTTYVTDMLLVSKAAEAKKLGDTPEFKKKMELARTKLLMEALLQNEAKAALTDDAMKKVYAEATKDMGNEQEVSARHILVESEDEAKAIAAELKKGGDFAAIAKEKSKDPGSKDQGGDLGFFAKDQMVPEFAEAAFKLDKGQVSGSGEVPVRLACHPPRRQADQAAADIRSGEGSDRKLRSAQGAGRPDPETARRRQDREDWRCDPGSKAGCSTGRQARSQIGHQGTGKEVSRHTAIEKTGRGSCCVPFYFCDQTAMRWPARIPQHEAIHVHRRFTACAHQHS